MIARSLALAAVAAAGFAATASAQPLYPLPYPPPHHHHTPPVVIVPPPPPVIVARPPVIVERPVVVVERPPVVVSAPPVVVSPPPVVVQKPPVPVYCLDTFIRDFRPCPGEHRIAIIHPVTKVPVEVCFTLPDRKLKEVEVERREVEFDYGLFHKVKLDFKHDGTVKVYGG